EWQQGIREFIYVGPKQRGRTRGTKADAEHAPARVLAKKNGPSKLAAQYHLGLSLCDSIMNFGKRVAGVQYQFHGSVRHHPLHRARLIALEIPHALDKSDELRR